MKHLRPTPRELAALQAEALTRLARERLEVFVELAWPILLPGTPFQSNWHISLICEFLEAVSAGQIRRLVINMPPRYGKSLLTSVFWPTWEWIRYPAHRWLFVSHSDTLATRHSLDRRRVLQDEWFRHRFPGIRLTRDQHAKAEFHNTKRGQMIATSMGGAITGKGGDRLVIDDPHSPDQVESDLQREHAIERFRTTLLTRLDDKRHGAIVVVMQRLHVQDLSGVCLDLGFEHLCLPALAPCRTTIVFPRSKKTLVREADEPLWPAREDRAALDELRRQMGSYAYAGQYDQRPTPRIGGFFSRDWWRFYHELPLGERRQIVQSWDLTFKDGDGSDYVVGLVAARIGALVYLLDRFKAKVGFVDTCAAIKTMLARYRETSAILVEDAANGPAVIDALKEQVSGVIAVSPAGGKQARAHAVQALVEAGQVLLPSPYTAAGEARLDRAWVEDLMTMCAAFPKGQHDDDVDALTQLLVWLRQHPHTEPCHAVRQPEPFFRSRSGLRRPGIGDRTPLHVRARQWANTSLACISDDDLPQTQDDDDEEQSE